MASKILLDLEIMKGRCLAPIADFGSVGDRLDTPDGALIYRDSGSKVLAVAHLDTVQNLNHFHVLPIDKEVIVYNAQLDDRLGAYVILDLLPRLDINVDVLLTEGEELCRSTARYFVPARAYNWIFSFDRAGTDVVLYDYEDTATADLLKVNKFRLGVGSYSDIADLEFLGVKGFNFGIGYHDNHFPLALAYMSETVKMVNLVAAFYRKYESTTFPHEQVDYSPVTHSKSIFRGDWSSLKDRNWFACEECGKKPRSGTDDDNCVYDYGLCCTCYQVATGEVYERYKDW